MVELTCFHHKGRGDLSNHHIELLLYSFLVLLIQIQSISEGIKKRSKGVAAPNLKATPGLLFMSLFVLFVTRWFLFLLACFLLPNLLTIIPAVIIFSLRLWELLFGAISREGTAKEISVFRNRFLLLLSFLETAFVAYFIIFYFL